MALTKNLSLVQGEDYSCSLKWQVNTAAEGQPEVLVAYDFTGATLKLQFRRNYADLDTQGVLLELTDAQGIVKGSPATNGTLTIEINPTQITSLRGYSGVYDLFCTYTSGKSEKLLQGSWTVEKRVTV